MTFFLVIDLVLRIFPFFFHIFRMFTMLNVVYMTISSQEKHNFHSVHAFTHIRQHYFSKYWGGPMHGGSPTSTFGGDRPPQSPLGLRPCPQISNQIDAAVAILLLISLWHHRRSCFL